MGKSFEAACLSAPSVCLAYGKFVSLYICLFSMKLKIIGKFCFIFFVQMSTSGYFVFSSALFGMS